MRTISILLLAFACFAQTGAIGPAISAYLLRAGSSTFQAGDYRWLRLDPPLSLTFDAAGNPHLGIIPPGPVVLPTFDPPLTTTTDVAGLLHVGLAPQTINITSTSAPIHNISGTFVALETVGALAGRLTPCQPGQLWIASDPGGGLSFCNASGTWSNLTVAP